jgi:hypothetical protein
VVTADGPVLWPDDELGRLVEEPLAAEAPDDAVGLPVLPPWEEAADVVVAPLEPVAAMTPNASTNVAKVAAAIRRRISLMRAARACSRWRTDAGVLGVGFEAMRPS